ncbi:MAG: hypothetical protein HZT40_19240 [Candidatus Thiothrix singaporensis]|uniref:Uncharacterized protein n=1 Tax=Candidatus Thiothrix singaporensis TaxID=2799669 RepID=A0A7L6AW86_9GAMM|nr:MAG: hypothetical protein HZT40_19240 [Candidatus Thiothrix singaporensis]
MAILSIRDCAIVYNEQIRTAGVDREMLPPQFIPNTPKKVEPMKYLTALLAMAGMMIHPLVLADDAVSMQQSADAGTATESNASAVADLCNTYAKEDGVAADKKLVT